MQERVRLLLEFRFPTKEISTKDERLRRAKDIIDCHGGEIYQEKVWMKKDTEVVEIYLLVLRTVMIYQKSTFESALLREYVQFDRGCGASALLEV